MGTAFLAAQSIVRGGFGNVTMGGVTYPFSYTYDLAGDLTQETYPSGRQVNYTYDMAKRPLTVNGVSAGVTTNYVQSVGYYPHGAPQFWQYGNGLWCWQNVNKMLTSWEVWATQNNNGNNWMFVAYNGFDNSENVIAQTEGFGPGVPWNSMTFLNGQFAYDNLSRLFSVTDTNYTRTYHYDEFGNQSIQSYAGIAPVGFAPQNSGGNPFNPATNHLTAVDTAGGYDPRGMVTKLGSGTVQMAYDAEGNMKNSSDTGTGQSITWIFDAEGQRAQKLISGGSWTLYVHDAFGQLAASYNNNGVTPACSTCYLTYDMLGSPRLITDPNQNVVARHDFIPFGEEIPNGTAGRNGNFGYTSNVTQAFTAQEADGGTASLDFYNARHFAAALGSFVQPDPYNAGADLLHPQSWNGYGYVLGNPLGLVDPSGMQTDGPGFTYIAPKGPDFSTDTKPYNNGFLLFLANAFGFLSSGSTCTNCGGNNGNAGSTANKNPAPAKSGTANKSPVCFAQLKSRAVDDPIASRVNALHTFWWVQGSSGQRIISGGPVPPSGSNQRLNVWVNPKLYQGRDTPSAHLVFSSGLSSNSCGQVDSMINAAQSFPNGSLVYDPMWGPNSNTAAKYFGDVGGFNPSFPFNAYQWNAPLLVPQVP